MSKSRKRLIIRLSIVTAIIALGLVALLQSQSMSSNSKPNDGSGSDNENPIINGAKRETAPVDAVPEDSDPYGLSKLASWQGQPPTHPPTSPSPTVVRGNNDGTYSTDSSPGAQVSVGDGAADSFDEASSPPAQSPFEQRAMDNGARPLDELPPLRPNPPPSRSLVAQADYTAPIEPAKPTTNPAFSSAPNDVSTPKSGSSNNSPYLPVQSQPVSSGSNVVQTDETVGPSGQSSPFANSDLSATNLSSGGSIGQLASASTSAALPVPGGKELEGVQAPSLSLEKRAPAEIQVGRQTTFHLKVQNVGQVEASQVVVFDRIPKGTRYVDSTPQPNRADDGSLIWNLGKLEPGGDATIAVHVIPTAEGEIGSVATVAFQTQASVRTICTKPVLKVEHSAPSNVLIGQDITLDIKVTNNGTGDAIRVMLEEDVPEQLSHPAGNELEYEIGTLRPGESKALKLTLKAAKAGAFENKIIVRGEGNLIAEHPLPLEVVAPQLQVEMTGPTKRYLERQAAYTVTVKNPGTAPATDVELVSFLPKGMKFVNANNQGQYDPQTHAVYWSLTELPAKEVGTVELTMLPIEMGEQKIRLEGKANLGLADNSEQVVLVEGLAAIFFGLADTADPIEVGSDTVYHVRVVNQGSKTATNIRVGASLPAGLKPIGGDGPTTYRLTGQTIAFDPLSRLAPKDEAVFKIQVRGITDGDHRINVQVLSDEIRTPVSKEESTRVYADR